MKFNNLLYKDLPVFNIVLNNDDETQGLSVVSIVDDPAVCQSLFCFKNEEKKPMMFVDEKNEQHCITSVAILADVPIYRVNEYGNGYYVVFQKQTIRDLVEKYSKDNYNNLVSFQHNGKIVNDFIMLESYFVDKEKGIAPTQFDVPDGSWMVTYKCTNDDTWEMVKNELATGGYSIEILCDIEPAPDTQEIFDEPEPVFDEDEEFMNWLNELLKALEDADCEIIMESDKKKIKLNSDDEDDEDGLWSLNFEVERTDIAKAIDQKKAVLIDGKEMWVHSLGKSGENDVAVLYDPKNDEWETKDIKTIKTWEPTKTSIGTFPEVPSSITDNDDISIQRNVNTGSYSDLIHNRVPVMISYNDEQPQPHTGYRTCYIVAYGYTKANNECLRVFQQNGDSRSASEGELPLPSYRLMLTRRCKGFKPMQGVEKYPMSVLDTSIINWNGDRSMEPCVDHILTSDFD